MAVTRTTARNNARVEPEEVRTCRLCRRVLSRKQDLPRHMSLHKPPQERMKEYVPSPDDARINADLGDQENAVPYRRVYASSIAAE
ncbi:hypothetical protein A0H81_06807 [Grifola frondosa]|uniref:C2H2-type domain-containing protein n=1 Tax=Grifola frondosa TaxID=5627 RepID=A0A1C7M7W3_GRIFR|nr:hypothetical protein A0H81_06807 [Grifola frondosa]